MKKIASIVLAVLFFAMATAVFAGPITLEPGNMEKISSKYVNTDLKFLNKYPPKKIAIVECTGEFMQSKEVSAGAFEQRAAIMGAQSTANATNTTQWARIKNSKSTITLGDNYYAYAVDQVYELVSAIFKENGMEVIPRDAIAANEIYKSMDLQSEITTKGYTGGMFKDSVTTQGVKVSATDLGIFPKNPFKLMKLKAKEGEMAGQLGVDSLVKVNFYIDKGKNGEPVLKYLNIFFKSGLKTEMLGFKGSEKPVYSFQYDSAAVPNVSLKDSIISTVDISGPEKGTVDMSKYHNALLELVNTVVDITKTRMQESLAKN